MGNASTLVQSPDWLQLILHYVTLSFLSFGGPMAMIPDLHRYLVNQHLWIGDAQFTDSVVIAQASPGPNVLFIAVLGWNMGMNAGSYPLAILGGIGSLLAFILPSSTLYYLTANWVEKNSDKRVVRAFKTGMSPIIVALLIASGIVLGSANGDLSNDWPLWLLTAVTTLLVVRTRIPMLLYLALGAALGGLGYLGGL